MKDIGYFLAILYIVISQVMSVVFFIDICKTWDSILGIIIAGPFAAEFMGVLWPFFI